MKKDDTITLTREQAQALLIDGGDARQVHGKREAQDAIRAQLAPKPAQHTPGPWRVRGGSVYAAYPMPVCDVVLAGGHNPDPVSQANARLIAAAPDLLAWCERWLSERHPRLLSQAGADLGRIIERIKGGER